MSNAYSVIVLHSDRTTLDMFLLTKPKIKWTISMIQKYMCVYVCVFVRIYTSRCYICKNLENTKLASASCRSVEFLGVWGGLSQNRVGGAGVDVRGGPHAGRSQRP